MGFQIVNEQQYQDAAFCLGTAPKLLNSKIIANDTNNIIYCEEGVTLQNCTVTFVGAGNVVYLSKAYLPYNISVRIYTDSAFYMGGDSCMSGVVNFYVQEHQNIIIGREAWLAFGTCIMNSDAHMIFDAKTKTRINPSKSIFIGDHVWCAQNATIFKGSHIGSGCIIGGGSVLSGKKCPSNTLWAGNPAKKIKKDIFWHKTPPILYDVEQTEQSMIWQEDTEEVVFQKGNNSVDVEKLDQDLIDCGKDVFKRLNLLKALRDNTDSNRFFVE